MFLIHCPHCDAQHLVPNSHVQSMHRTSEGMIGYVRCPGGHTIVHQFAEAYAKPPRPACLDEFDQALSA